MGNPAEKLKKQIEAGLSSINIKDFGRELSDAFDVGKGNTRLRGEINKMVADMTEMMGKAFNGDAIDMSGMSAKFTELSNELEQTLARSFVNGDDPIKQIWENFYQDYKNVMMRVSDETKDSIGSMWDDWIAKSGRVVNDITKGIPIEDVFRQA